MRIIVTPTTGTIAKENHPTEVEMREVKEMVLGKDIPVEMTDITVDGMREEMTKETMIDEKAPELEEKILKTTQGDLMTLP